MSDLEEYETPAQKAGRSGAAFDRVIQNLVNGSAAAVIAAATGSPELGILFGSVSGTAAEEISFAARVALQRQDARVEQMMAIAEEHSGVPKLEIVCECLANTAKTELLARSVEAAVRSTTEEKIKLVSQLFAVGALTVDEAVVDEHLVALGVISALDGPHIRLLQLLKQPSPEQWGTTELNVELRYAWPERQIIQADQGLRRTLPALLARLNSLGLTHDLGLGRLDYQPLWSLTAFGNLCIDEMTLIAHSESMGDGNYP